VPRKEDKPGKRKGKMASLTISNPSLATGATLNFSFSGFYGCPGVWVEVVGGGGANFNAVAGAGTGSFSISETPGTYTLRASGMDAYENLYEATASFTVTGQESANNWILVDKQAKNVTRQVQEEASNWILVDKITAFVMPQAQEEANNWILVDKISASATPQAQEQANSWILVDKISASAIKGDQEQASNWILVDKIVASVIKGDQEQVSNWILVDKIAQTVNGGGGEPPSTNNWLVPALVIGGAVVIGAVASNKNKIKSTYDKIPKEIGKKPKVNV
jgi:hypothetical protein